MASPVTIRAASVEDCDTIMAFIVALARYEKAEDEVVATTEHLRRTLFNEQPRAHALICEMNGQAIGFAVYFFNYSTWQGQYGLYLEDLFVLPEHRGLGAGKQLLRYLAQLAVENDCGRFEWSVLDWNEPAIQFYRSIGALPKEEWVGYRLDGQALTDFAAS